MGLRQVRPIRNARADFALELIETLAQPVVGVDAAGRLTLVNAAARRLWGLQEELEPGSVSRGELCFEQEDGRELAPESEPLARALEGQRPVRERLRLIARDGESRLVDVTAKALRSGGGEIRGATLTIDVDGGEARSDEQLRDYASDIEMLTEVSWMLAELQDPDEAASVICTVATAATGAIAVLLWELVDCQLVMYRYEGGLAIEDLTDVIDCTRAGATRALAEASTVIERAGRGCTGEVPSETVAACGVEVPLGTAWHEPLTSGGRVTGVLSIVWMGVLEDRERPGRLIGPLAHHAATALERADLIRRLDDLARTDTLTGLANRRVWQETLDRELARARRESQPLSLVLIDIDHFKACNDTHGHPQGDRLLHDASRAWSECVRSTDLLARVGGEEFAVLLPGCPIEQACSVAERLRAGIPDGQTCSVGVITWDGLASGSELYAAADVALYRAKANGRNRVELGHLAEQQDTSSAVTH
jgi:diguanylate cyclase (GGDEF)-like protein/PAS domain S-box-containing protein